MKSSIAHRLGSSLSLGLSTIALALCLPACGSSEDGDPGGGAGTGGSPTQADVGTISTTSMTCTEPNSICMKMQVPSSMVGQPTLLVFDIYDTGDLPSHLPNAYAGYFTAPSLTPGAQLYFKLTDGGLQGDYWMWVLMYMEGGGYAVPVNGVDYVMRTDPAPLHLDGAPLNIPEPVVLGFL